MYQDINLQCADCGCDFAFTTGEQEFYASKGLTNSPKRCTSCRSSRKQMNGDSRQRERRMYDVICSECGCQTQVPFSPSEDKPVFCKPCFEQSRV